MKDPYTRAVLGKAQRLQTLEQAARLIASPANRLDIRAGLAAAIAALVSLIPSISAAQVLL